MREWSFPIGTLLGVELRMHISFFLLLGLSMSYSVTLTGTAGRGLGLCALLFLALLLRETTRSIAVAAMSLDLSGILLLPTGSVLRYATAEANERAHRPEVIRRLALVGPLTNIGTGLVLGSLILAFSPLIQLADRPWITPAHLLRAAVWVNVLLGAVNLLPVAPLDGGELFRLGLDGLPAGLRSRSGFRSLGRLVAVALAGIGLALRNPWLTTLGAFLVFAGPLDQGSDPATTDAGTEAHPVRISDVMLVDFNTLSASDTLEDALDRSVHSLQDVFPVVRRGSMVGAVSRQGILEALQTHGNGYIQGVMTRSFATAQPGDALMKTLGRIMLGRGVQLVPVLDGDRIVGILTPQNLSQSMRLLDRGRRLRRQES